MNKENYQEIQTAYMTVLNQYLCENVGLDDYQEMLDQSEYHFLKGEETSDFEKGFFGRKNIFIRNHAYVERLEKADLALLQENIQDGEIVITEELLAMVERTMEHVLSVRYKGTDKGHVVVYDAGVFQCNMAPGNALVLVISYDYEYDEEGNIVNRQIEDKKDEFVEKLQKKMVDEMCRKLQMPVCVFY